jgi:hypothetical protein
MIGEMSAYSLIPAPNAPDCPSTPDCPPIPDFTPTPDYPTIFYDLSCVSYLIYNSS